MKDKKVPHRPYSRLKGALREKDLSYGDVARILGISATSVCHKINGVSDFYLQEIMSLAKAMDKDAWDLFGSLDFILPESFEKDNLSQGA